jgi:hypothetical protein
MASESKIPAAERNVDPIAEGPPLGGLAAAAAQRGLPPVHLWNPPYCGDVGLKIGRDGTWFYRGSPIGRPALVKLFSTILRKDKDRYVLVTPVEMVAVEIEDAPFVAVEMHVDEAGDGGPVLRFRTHVDDWVEADAAHPLRFDLGDHAGVKPYLKIRGDLWALVSRPVTYDLLGRAEIRASDGQASLGVVSKGQFFVISPAEETEALT